ELGRAFSDARIDISWGAAGTHFQLTGGYASHLRSRFESLCIIAGNRLLSSSARLTLSDEIMSEIDPLFRWYRCLWKLSNNFRHTFCGVQQTGNGEDDGLIFGGTVNYPTGASAALCIRFLADETRLPTDQRDGWV